MIRVRAFLIGESFLRIALIGFVMLRLHAGDTYIHKKYIRRG